jgi:molecular chaperone GrpE (heat shock protein)
MLDSLRAMRAVQENTDSPVYHQINELVNALMMTLIGLGFSEFTVVVGEPFDPTYMEYTGYAQGQTGIVLEVSRIGYCIQTGVIWPVGVIIAALNVSLS